MILAALLLQVAAPPVPSSSPVHDAGGVKPPRIYDGVWVDEFEAQRFVADEGRSSAGESVPGIWLSIDRISVLRRLVNEQSPGAVLPDPLRPHRYHLRFEGREAADMACRPSPARPVKFCYGHLGDWPAMIVVDRVIAIQDLGPAPQLR